MEPDLSVEIAGIIFQNPVMNCAGTLDIEPAGIKELMQMEKVGAYVQKSITLRPWEGNPQPRICEVTAGMINRIGLQNVGVEEFVKKKLPVIYSLLPAKVVLIISVAGESIEQYVEIAVILESKSEGRIKALEINASCPNVKNGLAFGTDPNLIFKLVRAIDSRVELPLIVKLTPNVTDIRVIAKAAVSAGADALSLINTVRAAGFIRTGPDAGQWIEGGLSGPCIKPIALYAVWQAAKAVDVPIIAMGGIGETWDALEFLSIKNVWGVAVGTSTFVNPLTMAEIVDGLERYLRENGCASIADFKAKRMI